MKISIFGFQVNLFLFIFLGLFTCSLMGGCIYRVGWWVNVENYNKPYRWDKSTGIVTPVEHSGWCRVTPFFVDIYTIDTRPMQIRIEANNRVLNAMLVQYNPEGYKQFFDLHGVDNYDQAQLGEILKSYAYEGMASGGWNKDSLEKKYRFLKILNGTSPVENNSKTVKDSL